MKEHEILKHTRNYTSTGIIDDALIPYFDQYGHWYGDKFRWRHHIWVTSLMRMRHATLPASRRIQRSRAGTILLTSYIWRKSETLLMTYCAIEGSVIVPANVVIRAPSLRRVGGEFYSQTAQTIYLPYLGSVGGNFDVSRSCSVNAPRLRIVGGNVRIYGRALPYLESVGGRYETRWSFEFNAPKLVHVGGGLEPHKCTELVAPLLETVGRNLIAWFPARRIYTPKLKTVGGHFLASTAEEITAPQLRNVFGHLYSQKAKDFYHPSLHVVGEWRMHPGVVEEWHRRQAARLAIQGDDSVEI